MSKLSTNFGFTTPLSYWGQICQLWHLSGDSKTICFFSLSIPKKLPWSCENDFASDTLTEIKTVTFIPPRFNCEFDRSHVTLRTLFNLRRLKCQKNHQAIKSLWHFW